MSQVLTFTPLCEAAARLGFGRTWVWSVPGNQHDSLAFHAIPANEPRLVVQNMLQNAASPLRLGWHEYAVRGL